MDLANNAQRLQPSSKRMDGSPYVVPAFRRLTPEAAKELLLRHDDLNDPEAKQMLHSIEDLRKRDGSGPE